MLSFTEWETRQPGARHLAFAGLFALSLVLFGVPLDQLISLAFRDDRYTPNLAIPAISLALIWLNRTEILRTGEGRPWTGLLCAFAGIVTLGLSTYLLDSAAENVLAIGILALLAVWIGAFIAIYGTNAARSALFPLTLLVLMIPIPSSILDHVVVALQRGSAEMSYMIFRVTGIPVFREDHFRFALPGVTIEVAEECSGIRSSLSLFISSLVAGYLFLRSGWSRSVLAMMTIPIVIFKNAVRIVTISALGIYVDPGFLHGRLHRYGGLPFSLVALSLLIPLLLLLIKTERRGKERVVSGDPVSAAV